MMNVQFIYLFIYSFIHLFIYLSIHLLKPQNVLYGLWFIAFNATFNNISVISWRSVLLVEETGVPGENHRSVASHWQNLSHNVVSLKRDSNSQR
jgi:hypothetical protein